MAPGTDIREIREIYVRPTLHQINSFITEPDQFALNESNKAKGHKSKSYRYINILRSYMTTGSYSRTGRVLYPVPSYQRLIHLHKKAPAHGAMGRRIDPSWWTLSSISRSSRWYMTGITKAACYPVCQMVHYIKSLATIQKEQPM